LRLLLRLLLLLGRFRLLLRLLLLLLWWCLLFLLKKINRGRCVSTSSSGSGCRRLCRRVNSMSNANMSSNLKIKSLAYLQPKALLLLLLLLWLWLRLRLRWLWLLNRLALLLCAGVRERHEGAREARTEAGVYRAD
jgi:hypothetical protein